MKSPQFMNVEVEQAEQIAEEMQDNLENKKMQT